LPSLGQHSVLVLPIELSGYPFADSTLQDLATVFNGAGVSATGYYESVASFYAKSSYGALNLSYTIAPKYVSSYSPSALYALNSDPTDGATSMLRSALGAYKQTSGDTCSSFDSDSDGLIDATILIYSCPDNSRDSTIQSLDKADLYWAYCSWDYAKKSEASTVSPIGNAYMWASYDFMYIGATSPHVDAHTYIHESGHLMGLPDYYCYDTVSNPTTGKKSHPSPLGGVAMMDENVSDHDIATKFALGWLHPYVVTGPCSLTLAPSEQNGDCLLLPAKGSRWNGSAFTEYLLLELYTPTSLNELDATTAYSYHPKGYTTPGVRLLHVDARIVDWSSGAYEEDPAGTFISGHFYGVGANNTPSRRHGEASSGNYDAIKLLQADGTNSLSYGSGKGKNSNLFARGSSFSIKTFASDFPKGATFNDGESLNYQIAFQSVDAAGVQLAVTAL
jgi:M6 family metalloprotease-like protein